MKINIYYWNNGVGLVNDSILIKCILKDYDVITYDLLGKLSNIRKCDIGIHIQNFKLKYLDRNKINILMINEEWTTECDIFNINQLDYIFTKSTHAKLLLNQYHKNVINTTFFSLDRYYFPSHTDKFLHFKGKSIQKNTELIKNIDYIKILDSNVDYLSDNEITNNLNTHDIHICCSLYEGWGHYLWEAMSCGKLVICSEIPVFKEYLDPNLVIFIPTEKIVKFDKNHQFLNQTEYPLREGHFINERIFNEVLENKEYLFEFQKNNKDNIKNYFLEVTNKNKYNFLKIINNLI